MRFVAVKDVGNQARTTGQVQELVGKTNQTTRWNAVFQTNTAATIGFHVHEFTFALTQSLHHAALMGFFDVSCDQFDRFMALAIHIAINHAGFRHSQFVAFTAHVFQQNGEVQFTTTRHIKDAFFVGFFHTQSHVVLKFFLQTIPNLTTGHVLAFASSQGAGVDAEVHGQSWLVNFEHGQWCRTDWISDRDTNVQIGNAVDEHNVTRASFGHLHAVQATESQNLIHAAFDGSTIWSFHDHHIHHGSDGALADTADTNAAHKS